MSEPLKNDTMKTQLFDPQSFTPFGVFALFGIATKSLLRHARHFNCSPLTRCKPSENSHYITQEATYSPSSVNKVVVFQRPKPVTRVFFYISSHGDTGSHYDKTEVVRFRQRAQALSTAMRFRLK